jgi:MFS family permease
VSLFGLNRTVTIMLVFFIQSFAQGAWFPRVADIQLQLGLSEVELALALMAMPIGALLTFPFAAPIVERFGTRLTLMLSLPLFSLSMAVGTLSTSAATLFLPTLFVGIGHGITQIAMNVEADRVEAATGRRVMNRCHAMWSLGILSASVLGTLVRGIGIAPAPHLIAMVPFTIVAILLVAGRMDAAPPRPHAGPQVRKFWAMPTVPIFLLISFTLAAVLIEGAAYTWSVIYLRDTFDIPVWMETLTLPAFLTAMMIARLMSDGLVERYGPVRVASTLAAVSFAGLVLVVFGNGLIPALIGFAFMGFGVSVSFPLAISASARLGDRPASDNLAAFTVLQRFLFLVTPTIIGFIATGYGLTTAFACMLPFAFAAIFLARFLGPRPVLEEAPAK